MVDARIGSWVDVTYIDVDYISCMRTAHRECVFRFSTFAIEEVSVASYSDFILMLVPYVMCSVPSVVGAARGSSPWS